MPCPPISDSIVVDAFADGQSTFMRSDSDFAIPSEYFKKINWSELEEAGLIRISGLLRESSCVCNRGLVELLQHDRNVCRVSLFRFYSNCARCVVERRIPRIIVMVESSSGGVSEDSIMELD